MVYICLAKRQTRKRRDRARLAKSRARQRGAVACRLLRAVSHRYG